MDLDSPPKLLPISFSGFTPGWSKSMHQDATLHITEITTYTHTHTRLTDLCPGLPG